MRVGNRWSGFLQKFLKTAIPEIAEEKPLAPEGVFGEVFLEFSVDVARHNEEVRQPIVIKIHDPRAPAHKSILDTETRPAGGVFKNSLTEIVVEIGGVIHEIRFQDIETPIEIIITNGGSHASLFLAVLAEGNAADGALFPESAVMIVHEQQAGC